MTELLGTVIVIGAGATVFYTWYYLFFKGE